MLLLLLPLLLLLLFVREWVSVWAHEVCCSRKHISQYTNIFTMVWPRKSCISLTSLHTIVLYALHSQWSANVCMWADLSTPYLDGKKRNAGTRSEKKREPKGMCNSFSFRRFVRSNFFSLFLSFSVSLHFYRIHSKLNACCGGNRFQRRRRRKNETNTHTHIHTYQDGQAKRIR